jgi:hypothetical protein
MNKRSKRALVLTVAFVVVMAGGIAVAYWTAGGSGTGSASTGSTTPVTVKQTSTVTNLRPGGAPQTLSGTFDNGNDGPVYVTRVTAAVSAVAKASGAPAGECTVGDYTLADAEMPVNAQVPAGTSQGSWTGAKLSFNNKANANQDACKGATVSLTYTAN